MEQSLHGQEEKQGCTRTKYLWNRDRQDISERRFETVIRAAIDIASHVIASEGYREPNSDGDLIRILEYDGVLSRSSAERVVELVGRRNPLAHE